MSELVGKKFEEARKKKNLTQTDVAVMLGEALRQSYSLRQYQKLEKGEFPKFKKEIVTELDKILGTNLYGEIYESNVPRGSSEPSYIEQRRWGKIVGEDFFVPLIPFKARAGYSKNYINVDYINQEFETYQMPPGIKYRGSEWRWFEVGGDSMLPILSNGDYLLCSLVPEADWLDIEQYLIYVIVWNSEISVKRVAIDKGDFILISENEELEGQKRIAISNVKEIWKLRRQLNARFPPTKKFKIKV